jgi:hypothetical protein
MGMPAATITPFTDFNGPLLPLTGGGPPDRDERRPTIAVVVTVSLGPPAKRASTKRAGPFYLITTCRIEAAFLPGDPPPTRP